MNDSSYFLPVCLQKSHLNHVFTHIYFLRKRRNITAEYTVISHYNDIRKRLFARKTGLAFSFGVHFCINHIMSNLVF